MERIMGLHGLGNTDYADYGIARIRQHGLCGLWDCAD